MRSSSGVTPRTGSSISPIRTTRPARILPYDEVKRLHAGLPGEVLLVLDAAYAEYVRRNDYASGMELAAEAENVVMTRTFSKVFGLANLRIGWAYGPADVVDALNRTRGPFNVNGPALAAGAAALADQVASGEGHRAQRATGSNGCRGEIAALGLRVTPSIGNFLLIHFPEASRQARRRGRRVSARAWPRAPPRRRPTVSERAPHDRRVRGGEPGCRGRHCGRFPAGRSGVSARTPIFPVLRSSASG